MVKLLGFDIDTYDFETAVSFAKNLIETRRGGQIVTINPEMILQSQNDTDLADILNKANLVFADGIGVVLALKSKGIVTKQVPGIEFSENLINICAQKGYPIGFLGASNDVVNTAATNMQKKYQGLNISFIHLRL